MTKQKFKWNCWGIMGLILPGILILACSDEKGSENASQPPNLVLILTDDHAKNAMSIYHKGLIETPNLDRIGEEGMVFDKCFVTNSICAPSRAAILTSKYSHLNGLRDNMDIFDSSQPTFISHLHEAGYETVLVGKWHLKTAPEAFDYWKILIDQGEYYQPRFVEMGDTVVEQGYTTDIITDIALDRLNQRDPDKPFCLLFWHKAPHRNWMANTKYLGALNGKEFELPENFYDDYQSRSSALQESDMRVADMYLSSDMKLHKDAYGIETGTGGLATFNPERNWEASYNRLTDEQRKAWDTYYQPINDAFKANPPQGRDLAEWKFQRYMEDYIMSIMSVDENVGRLLDYLNENQLEENTMVLYSSDQGFYLGEHGWYDKRYMYEESFSTPLCIKYPKMVNRGQRSDALVLNIDFGPTFLDFAGIDIPEDMQGESLKPILLDEEVDWRNSLYYHYYQAGGWHSVPRHLGVRDDRYKLLSYYELGDWEFYDLEKDPMEMHNLINDPNYEDEISVAKQELARLQAKYEDPIAGG